MTEILSHENTGSKIEAGTDLSLRAREKDISMTGGTLQGKNVTLEAKKNIDLRAAENTTHTVTKERSSSAGISVTYSFAGGITDVGIHADRSSSDGIGDRTTYTPAIIQAQEKLSMTSGADTNIIGSQASGKKVNMKVGGNLNIESLQEKDDYREKNSSSGFNISASMSGGINTNDPDIAASYSKGKIHSNWKSITGQAGIYAGADGFDIHVKKNTDLQGSVIASEAASDKNTLSTGTLTFSDLENTASYKVSDKGVSFHAGGNVKPGDKGLLPEVHMPIHGSASSVTKSAVSPGTIEILRRSTQNLNGLSRDTKTVQNPLEKIFDKDKILEQQEAAELFGELANRAIGDIAERMHWKEGDPRKILLKGLTGGVMSKIAGGSFGKGMTAGAVNELLIARLLSWQDAYGHPIIPTELLQGISYGAGTAIGGTQGAVIAQSETKNNIFEHFETYLDEQKTQALLKAIEECGSDENAIYNKVAKKYINEVLARIGREPEDGYEFKVLVRTENGKKYLVIAEVMKSRIGEPGYEHTITGETYVLRTNGDIGEEPINWGALIDDDNQLTPLRYRGPFEGIFSSGIGSFYHDIRDFTSMVVHPGDTYDHLKAAVNLLRNDPNFWDTLRKSAKDSIEEGLRILHEGDSYQVGKLFGGIVGGGVSYLIPGVGFIKGANKVKRALDIAKDIEGVQKAEKVVKTAESAGQKAEKTLNKAGEKPVYTGNYGETAGKPIKEKPAGGTDESPISSTKAGEQTGKVLEDASVGRKAEESIQPEKTGDRVGESVKKEPVDGKAENPPKSEKVEESTGVKADKTAQTEKTGGSVSKEASSTTGELKGSKSVDDLLEDATPGRKTKGKSTQYIKKGGYEKAKEEFDALEKVEGSVKETDKGFTAQLPDGRDVNVRNQSREGSPTLEIYNPINKRHIKIRYEE